MFLLLGLPPLLTLLLVAIRMTLRHRAANADSYRARGAAKNAIHALKRLEASNGHQAALTAIQTFVGDKLKRAPETMTQQDITAYLSEQSVSPTLIDCAKTLMDACEAAIYAKQIKLPADEACSQARELIIELDKVTR